VISVLEGESLSAGLYDLVIYSTFLCTTDYYDLTNCRDGIEGRVDSSKKA